MNVRTLLFLMTSWAGLMISYSDENTQSPASFAVLDERAKKGDVLSVVFLGGSLTWGANATDPQRTSYRALMSDWLRNEYPQARWQFHDASIGGTGSTLGLFRMERDVLSRDPDLVFLDFTVNDGIQSADPVKLATYEKILRELVECGSAVVVVTMGDRSTAVPSFNVESLAGYLAHKKLAAYYGAPVGDALESVRKVAAADPGALARMYPFDGIHPDDPGYEAIFQGVREGFLQAVRSGVTQSIPQKPLSSQTVSNDRRVFLRDLEVPDGWRIVPAFRTSMWFDGLSSRWMGNVVAAGGGKENNGTQALRVRFEGTFIAVFGEADEKGLGFYAAVDGKPLIYKPKKGEPSEIWPFDTSRHGKGRLFQYRILADDLPPGPHELEIRPAFTEDNPSGELRIESICFATITSNE